jgi:hypothetical protein
MHLHLRLIYNSLEEKQIFFIHLLFWICKRMLQRITTFKVTLNYIHIELCIPIPLQRYIIRHSHLLFSNLFPNPDTFVPTLKLFSHPFPGRECYYSYSLPFPDFPTA